MVDEPSTVCIMFFSRIHINTVRNVSNVKLPLLCYFSECIPYNSQFFSTFIFIFLFLCIYMFTVRCSKHKRFRTNTCVSLTLKLHMKYYVHTCYALSQELDALSIIYSINTLKILLYTSVFIWGYFLYRPIYTIYY